MESSDREKEEKRFLLELYRQVKGDPAVQKSMYQVGSEIGLEKSLAGKIAEELIGLGMVEIRTLSGGIGITPGGAEEARRLGAGGGSGEGPGRRLGDGPIVEPAGRQGIENLTTTLKNRAGALGLAFEELSELMADLKTIDAQMTSPRPKTAVVRESLRSVAQLLQKREAADLYAMVTDFLGS